MIVKEKISKGTLEEILENSSETMLKVVVDVDKEIMSIGCAFHIDCAEELTDREESHQKNLWGANFYKDGRIDFISLINIKPLENNRVLEIQNPEIKKRVGDVIKNFL